MPYAFADFINSGGVEIAALYRERFAEHEQAEGLKAQTAVAVWTICAETDEQAQRLASSGRMAFTMLRRGELIAVPPPETALEFIAREERVRAEAAKGPASRQQRAQRRTVVGSPATVRRELEDVAAKYAADEVIAVNILYDHQARRRSYELLAQAFRG
jgi:alkanesulfonate monooxygenase SsuD/methylene tetrahydromethanopterin reductase-like flavin-dependent oxidoreductase (luciferase family)